MIILSKFSFPSQECHGKSTSLIVSTVLLNYFSFTIQQQQTNMELTMCKTQARFSSNCQQPRKWNNLDWKPRMTLSKYQMYLCSIQLLIDSMKFVKMCLPFYFKNCQWCLSLEVVGCRWSVWMLNLSLCSPTLHIQHREWEWKWTKLPKTGTILTWRPSI